MLSNTIDMFKDSQYPLPYKFGEGKADIEKGNKKSELKDDICEDRFSITNQPIAKSPNCRGIYFIGTLNRIYEHNNEFYSVVKIGYTKQNIRSRLRGIQVGCPFRLKVLAYIKDKFFIEEKNLHKRFRSRNIRGEWYLFKPTKNDNLYNTIRSYEY